MDEGLQELQKYLFVIQRRLRTFALLCVVFTTSTIIFGYSIPKQYQADSTVFIEENIINNLVKGLAYTSETKDDVRVLKDALLSRNMINKVLKKIDPDLVNNAMEINNEYVASLQKRTAVQVKGGDLFNVSIEDNNPKFAQVFINELVRAYIEENMSSQREETYGANRFFDEQLKLFKNKLDISENAIIEFRKNQKTYLSLSETTVLQDLRKLTSDQEMLQIELMTLTAKQNVIENQLETLNKTVAFSTTFGANNDTRLAMLKERLAVLLLTYTDNYPEVVKIKAEIEEENRRLKAADLSEDESNDSLVTYNPIYVETRQALLELEADISAKQSKVERIGFLIAKKKNMLQDIPENQKQLRLLEQERDSARVIYQDLLGRQGQAEVTKQMEIGDKSLSFRLVDPAILPTVPISPNLRLLLVIAIAGGLLGAFATVLLVDNWKTSTINDIDELVDYDVEILGVVPFIDSPEKCKSKRVHSIAVTILLLVYYACVVGLLVYEMLDIKKLTS
jgi:polysaccharide chain length determinant protein (PEP-CTERM system associated)